MSYHLQTFIMYLNNVTSQQDIIRQSELMSATAGPGITGLGAANTLSLERVYQFCLKKVYRGQFVLLVMQMCSEHGHFLEKQTHLFNCNKASQCVI